MMKSLQKRYVFLLCLLSFLFFFLGSREKRVEGDMSSQNIGTPGYFHEKKDASDPLGESCATSQDCHFPFPHEKDRRIAAFLNMHTLTLDCLVCHFHSQVKMYVESTRGKRLFKAEELKMTVDVHDGMEKTPSCRMCHSRQGMQSLVERTGVKFKTNFTEPFVLKLIEEDSKKWDVPGF
jgi:hypothetical protein